jgi:hypothetical protein
MRTAPLAARIRPALFPPLISTIYAGRGLAMALRIRSVAGSADWSRSGGYVCSHRKVLCRKFWFLYASGTRATACCVTAADSTSQTPYALACG